MQRAGNRRHRVTLQRQLESRDTLNQLVGDWIDVLARIPCDVETLAAGETVQNNQVVSGSTHAVTMLWRAGIEPTMRLLWSTPGGTQILNIVGVSPDDRNRDLLLSCKQ